jgi:hypothetical protein
MDRKITTAYITRTGILLALALIFQIGLNKLGQPIVGPLVNMVLLVTAGVVGTLSGVIVGCFTPVIALAFEIIGLPILVPFIALGNTIYVILFNLVRKKVYKGGDYFGLVIAALGKFAFLALSVKYVAIGLFLANLPPQKANVIANMFTLPQLYTALAGGIIAVIIMKLLPKGVYLHRVDDRN